MRADELVARVPELYHVTPAASWDGVLRRGLLSVARLVDLYGMDEQEAAALLSQRRPVARRLDHPEHGVAWLRDQRPLNVPVLARLLDDMTVAGYLRRLNGLVFLWADPARLERLWRIPRYADTAQVVLTLDTASVLRAHGAEAVLTSINSGAVRGPAGRRGTHTFRPVADVPARGERVAELAVPGAIPDLRLHLRRAVTRLPRARPGS